MKRLVLILLLLNAAFFTWHYTRTQPAVQESRSAATVPQLELLREVQSSNPQSQIIPAPSEPEPPAMDAQQDASGEQPEPAAAQ